MVDGSIKIEPSFKAVVDEIDSSAVFNDGTYESKTANAESLKGAGFELFTIDDEGSEVYKLDNVLATVKESDEGTVTYIYEEVRSVYLDYPETIHEEIVDEDPIDRPIPPTPTFPEINAVIITALSGLSEGDPSVMAGAVVARISVNGGTSPYVYKLTSGDDKFVLNGYQIKTKEALKEGNYEVSVSVIDKNGKTGTGTVSIVVKETNIKIDSVTINYSASTYEEKSEGTKAGATLATIKVEGGNKPYSYKISGNSSVEVDESGNIKAKSDLKVGDIKAKVTVTDADGDTANTEFNITVQSFKLADITEVVKPRGQSEKTWNKNVSDLQKADITVVSTGEGTGKITGTSKYVIDYQQPDSVDGNWVALHIDNTKLPLGEVKYVTEKGELDPDTKDWNFNIRLDNKTDRTFKIQVDEEILYTIDLAEVVLEENKEIDVTIDNSIELIKKVKETYYDKYQNKKINSSSPEFKKDEYYYELGEVETADTITINEVSHDGGTNGTLSVGRNSYVEVPSFIIEDSKLKVSILHLAVESKENKSVVKCGDKTFNVTLSNVISSKELKVSGTKAINTQKDRKNEVTFEDNKVTEISNNGRHVAGVIISEGDSPITDPFEIVIRIDGKDKLGFCIPENGCTYDVYMKYKDGDYNSEDIKVSPITADFKLMVVGKGFVEFNITLNMETVPENISKVISPRNGELSTFNKYVKDLQYDDVTVKDTTFGKGEATGTLKWITDWNNPAGSEGNWVAFHIDNTKLPEGEIKYAIGDSEASPDTNDWNVNIRLDNKSDKVFKIKVDGEVLYELDLSKLTLLNSPDVVLKVLDQSHQMGNTPVSDIQTDVVISKESKITGTLKYVKGLELSGERKYPDGNYLCLHIENAELPDGTITSGINNMTNVDTKDYDILLTVTNDSKLKPYKIAVNNKVLYEFDLSGLNLLPDEAI